MPYAEVEKVIQVLECTPLMARPGMADVDGGPVGWLEGPLRWAADLGPNALVEIAGALSPPA